MTVKVGAKLPDGDTNGLGRLLPALINHPDEIHVAVVLFDVKLLNTDTDSGDVTPTVRIRAIEPVGGPDGKAAQEMLTRAREDRTGLAELPFELGTVLTLFRDEDLAEESDDERMPDELADDEDDGEVVDAEILDDPEGEDQ